MSPTGPQAAAESAAARLAAFRAVALDRLLWLSATAALLFMGALVATKLPPVTIAFGVVQVLALFGLAFARKLAYRPRAWCFVALTAANWAVGVPLFGAAISVSALISGLSTVFLAALLLGPRAVAIVGVLLLGELVWLPRELFQAGWLRGDPGARIPWFDIAASAGYFLVQLMVGISLVIHGLERGFAESLSLLRAAEENEHRFRGIFEAGPEVVVLVDSATGAILDVNPAFERLLGWPRAESLERTLADLDVIRLEPLLRLRERIWAIGTVERVEMELRRRDGAVLVSEVSGRRTNIGGRAMTVVVARDVTHERHLTAAVRHAQRVEAMGSLAAGIAHNFRNALATVVPNIAVALENAPAELRPVLEDAQRSAAVAVELARDLTRMARRQDEGPRESVDAGAVVREVAGIARRTFGAGIDVRDQVVESLPRAAGRTGQLHQVLLNLCINARDALESTARPSIVLEARRAVSGGVELAVSDNGCGMAPEVLQRAGEPFFTTKPEGRGTGLGLSTAFAIVRDAGGRMTVTSRLGVGTTFRIELPEAGGERAESSGAPARRAVDLGGRVLLVDDDERALASLVHQIEGLGIEVDGFSDPLTAWEHIERQPQRYRVLLTDLDMPSLDGVELAARARRVNGAIAVVVLTGSPDARRPSDAAAVLLKPISMPDLAVALERCLGLSPAGGEVPQA